MASDSNSVLFTAAFIYLPPPTNPTEPKKQKKQRSPRFRGFDDFEAQEEEEGEKEEEDEEKRTYDQRCRQREDRRRMAIRDYQDNMKKEEEIG